MGRSSHPLGYTAPVIFYEYPPDGEATWPCSDCLPWHCEVVLRDGEALVREWHAVGCPAMRDDI